MHGTISLFINMKRVETSVNMQVCIINVWGYTEILPFSRFVLSCEHANLWDFFGFVGPNFTENSSRRKLSCTSRTGTANSYKKITKEAWGEFHQLEMELCNALEFSATVK